MTRKGPVKHCFYCNHAMMKQVQKCAHCGREQTDRLHSELQRENEARKRLDLSVTNRKR